MKTMKEMNTDIAYDILFNMGDGKEYTFESLEDNILTVVAEDGTTFKHHICSEEV